MRPNNVIDSVREGDLGGDAIAMSFDENSFAHLMSVLTDLYKNPELAVIREYSTNARDAHIEAGNPAPIQVYTPTALSPFFRVKDFGVGMDHDTIANTYSKYGASTKRGGDEQTGMLGLGCKSGLTYTNQFTVIGVKDGVKTTVVVSRNEDGSGVMQVVDTSATTEPNGVEITVPSKPGHFTTAVRAFFRFWPKGSVLIDGKELENGFEYTDISDQVKWIRAGGNSADYVIMGGVAYEIDYDRRRVQNKSYSVHFYVPMGAVNFTPSRESLHYTPKTLKALEALYDEFDEGLRDAGHDEVASATSHQDAFMKAEKWRNSFPGVKDWKFKYDGAEVPRKFTANGLMFSPGGYRGGSAWGQDEWGAEVYREDTLFVTGYDGLELNAGRRKKVAAYFKNVAQTYPRTVYILDGEFPNDKYLAECAVRAAPWETIKPYKVPREGVAYSNKVFAEPAYDVVDLNGVLSSVRKSDIEAMAKGKEIIYFSSSQIRGLNREADRARTARTNAKSLAKYGPVVVLIGENRFEKFKRDFPNAVTAREWLKNYLATNEAAMTEGERLTIVLKDDSRRKERYSALRKIKDQVNDPEVVRILTATGAPLGKFAAERREHYALAGRFGVGSLYEIPDLASKAYIESTYPLFKVTDSGVMMNDVVLYMNAKYKTIKDGK